MIRLLTVLLAAAAALAGAEPAVELVYFHDEDRASLNLIQIAFPSASRGLAIGRLEERGRRRPDSVALITSDAGKTWRSERLPDNVVSLFCLDDSACWLVTTGGVYFSAEGGLGWRRLSKEKSLTRVHFRDRERGFGIGAERKLVQTSDGGKTWREANLESEITTSEDRTVFHEIAFLSPQRAIITGRVEPRHDWRFPIWMQADPEDRRETPALALMVQSTDGGATWKPSTSSMFGRISRVRPNPLRGYSLALLEFHGWFTYPSEVYRIDNQTGETKRVLRWQSIAVTDVGSFRDGSAFAAGFEPPGTLARTPVPGRVRVLRSTDLTVWKDLEVDYRAEARQVSAAVAPDGTAWFATDTGMILRYRPGS